MTVSAILGLAVAAPAWSADAPVADNPLKVEMRQLDMAFINLINDVVLNNLSAVEGHLHEIYALKEKTYKALENGEVKLPKNNENRKLFIEFDVSFHKKLEQLIEASKKGDMKAVKGLAHKLLNACIRCHGEFRQ